MTAPDARDAHDEHTRDEHTRDEHTREDSFDLEVSTLGTRQPLTRGPRTLWLRWAQIASVVVVVAGVLWALVVPHRAPGTATTPIQGSSATNTPVPRPVVVYTTAPGVTRFQFAGEPFTCPVAAAWSPDGQQFAILGYESCAVDDSGNPYDQGAFVAIFDASAPNATPRAVIDLADQLTHFSLPRDEAQVVPEFEAIGWGPDGHTLAMTFNLGADYGDVLLLPIDQGGGQMLFVSQRSAATTLPATPPPDARYFPPAWNTVTGKPEQLALPLAVAYSWNGDALVAAQPLGNSSPESSTATNASVSLWQVGVLFVGAVDNAARNTLALSLSTSGPVWSPDGTFLLPYGLGVMGWVDATVSAAAVESSNSGSQTLGGLPSDAPTLPIRDAGLRAAIADLANAQALLAWRPDGQRLAMAQPTASVGGTQYGYTLDIYDSSSGKRVAHLAESGTSAFDPVSEFAAWSPDGQHLLLLNEREHTAMLFSAAALGG